MPKKIQILIYLFTIFCFSQDKENVDIENLISKSRDKKKSVIERKNAVDSAYSLTLNQINNQYKSKLLQRISSAYLSLKDSLKFKESYKVGLSISNMINDSITTANHHWNLGIYYRRNDKKDSAYFFYNVAKNIFDDVTPNHENVGKLLLNMARIQKDLKDYSGSEVTTFKAIRIFEPLKDYGRLYNCYNNLGIVYKSLENYEKSLEYHNTALTYLQKVKKNEILKTYTLNNIGLVYRYQGKYKEAIDNFQEALSYDSLYVKNPRHYATLVDNLAYSKFLSSDTSELPNLFYKSLEIRDSLSYKSGIAVSKMHLAEYYWEEKDTTQSMKYVSEARSAAIESRNVTQLLNSLLLSSKVDSKIGSQYLNTYIHINDSLIKNERTAQNKFARIRFETDQYISENEKLTDQIQWVLVVSSAVIFFGFLIYIITQQRTRNKELEMEQ